MDFLPIYFYPQAFFYKYIEHNNYSIIIGLGDGTRHLSKIKIEIQTKNAYNYQEIYPFSPIFLDLNMPTVDIYDSNYFQIGTSMGTYNCNWLAYKTQLSLNQRNLDTKHLFLHLPRQFNASIIADQIQQLINDNHLI